MRTTSAHTTSGVCRVRSLRPPLPRAESGAARSVALDHHAQYVAGREDDLVLWSNNEYLADELPNSEIHPLDAGHFAWEQAPDEYGRLIVEWVTGGFQRRVAPWTA